MNLRARFVKQRNIDAKPMAGTGRSSRPGSPSGANRGMDDLLEFPSLDGIGKNGLTEPYPIGATGVVKRLRPEGRQDGLADVGIIREQIARTLVGVE